jgi:ferritin
MRTFFAIILSVFIYNTSFGQCIKKNSDVNFIDFVNSFKEEQINDIIDFRKVIHNKASMSKEEALKYVYNTKDTTRLYCIEFN